MSSSRRRLTEAAGAGLPFGRARGGLVRMTRRDRARSPLPSAVNRLNKPPSAYKNSENQELIEIDVVLFPQTRTKPK
jgi:hypothetical protein